MFSKLALFTAVSMAVFAAAIPTPGEPATTNTISNSCNAGPVQCCNSLFESTTPGLAQLLGLIGIVAGVTGQVGLTCDPITVIGVSGTSCSSQPVCCSGNHFDGLVSVGCSPVNANL